MRRFLLFLTTFILTGSLFLQAVRAFELPVPRYALEDPLVKKAEETFQAAKKAAYDVAVIEGEITSLISRIEKLEREAKEKANFDHSYEDSEIKKIKAEISRLEKSSKPFKEKAKALQKIADQANVYTFVAFYDTAKKVLIPKEKVFLCRSGKVDVMELAKQKLGKEVVARYQLADNEETYKFLESDVHTVTVISLAPRHMVKVGQVAPTGEAKSEFSTALVSLGLIMATLLVLKQRQKI